MPKNKFQDAVFTVIMSFFMVYAMIIYNVALNTGGVTGQTFLMALHELPIMWPAAFVLEFFIVGKLARALAFTVVTPQDRPQIITYAISICICCIMCPVLSLIATLLFKEPKTFGTGTDLCHELPNGNPVADVLLRSTGTSDLPHHLPCARRRSTRTGNVTVPSKRPTTSINSKHPTP